MPAFPKPSFSYNYDPAAQITALRHWRDNEPGRQIPRKAPNRLLLATWNIANLGLQQRRPEDYALLAEMLEWFDIVTIQEVNERLDGLLQLQQALATKYSLLFSDVAGNKERLAFIYDANKVQLLELVGEVAIPPADLRYIKLPGITQKFEGFDRNPYLAAFKAGAFEFTLASVHLYFGSESAVSMNRRSLETYAVARWADNERNSDGAYRKDIIVLGDFNLPKAQPGDRIYEALTKRGLKLPQHTSEIGSAIASDNHYDQIAFFPGETRDEFTGHMGVFDFDGALFQTLWQNRGRTDFMAYMRYYISDHRVMWAQFKTDGGA